MDSGQTKEQTEERRPNLQKTPFVRLNPEANQCLFNGGLTENPRSLLTR